MAASLHPYCTFEVANLFLGIDVLSVQEILRGRELARVPLAPGVIRGLLNLRGQIVPALDLRQRLHLPPRTDNALSMNVIVRVDDGTVSLQVDAIGDVLELDPSTFEATPDTLRGPSRELVQGVCKMKDRLLLILDVAKTTQLPDASAAA